MLRKSVDELTFIDDYMFGEVMKNKELCKGVLECLLGVEIRDIEYPQLQKALEVGYESHGIRMDVYLKDDDTVYDIELQNKAYKDLGRRIRFYQSMIDADALLKGTGYLRLPKSLIIFICTHDPFARGAIKYSFRTVCNELPDLDINDNAQKIVYNANGYNLIEDERLKAFLKFISTNKPTDNFTKSLENEVETVKLNEIFRSDYMVRSTRETDLLDEGEEIGFSKGHAAGIIEGAHQQAIDDAKNFLEMKILSYEQIAAGVGLTVEEVEKLANEIKAGIK